MAVAQYDTNGAGRSFCRLSYIDTQVRFWDRSVAIVDGSHCTTAHHFSWWECCWNVAFFSVILGMMMAQYIPWSCARLDQKCITSYMAGHTYCNTLETMEGCLCVPSSHLPSWETAPKSGTIVKFWEKKLMVMAQCDTNGAGRRLCRRVLSYIDTKVRFWDRSVAMDGSRCNTAHHFSCWECCWNVAF